MSLILDQEGSESLIIGEKLITGKKPFLQKVYRL